MRPALLLIVAISLFGGPAVASTALNKARSALRIPRYAEAISFAERALDDPDLSVEERVEAYEILATALVARGEIDRALEAFDEMLELAPDRELEGTVSPKIREVFDRARAGRAPPPIEPKTATIAAPTQSPAPLLLEEQVDPPPAISRGVDPPPIAAPISHQSSPAIFERWWFWALAGVVVLGAAGGAYAALRGPSDPEPRGNLPPIRLD